MTTDYKHPDYKHWAPKWAKVRAAAAGEDAVKAGGTKYLPNPSETDVSDNRYKRYLERAVYYNATGRTLSALVGIAFANWPTIEVNKLAQALITDIDTSGESLVGQAQLALSEVMLTGRAGLLVDHTGSQFSARPRTLAQAEAMGLRPYVSLYGAESIFTWETAGGRLVRLVLGESYTDHSNGEADVRPQLREMVLTEEGLDVHIWRKLSDQGQFILIDTAQPTAAGSRLKSIPFVFIGARHNDCHCDTPPLLDLANMNLAHYRNSADYEESAFLLGQPQLVITGVTEDWANAHGSGITLGARGAIPLPLGGDAKLLQVAPNTLAKEAMDNKERQMQALGARLVAQGEAVKTATQSASETKAAYSVLSLACDNVSDAYSRALTIAQSWVVPSSKPASFAISTRFNDLTLDANAIREVVAAWQAGLVPQSDAWTVLRQLGVIDQGKTDAQLAGEIEAQGPALNLDEAA